MHQNTLFVVVFLFSALLPQSLCYFWREPEACVSSCPHSSYAQYTSPAIKACCKKFEYEGEKLFDSRCKKNEPRCNFDKHISTNYGKLGDQQQRT